MVEIAPGESINYRSSRHPKTPERCRHRQFAQTGDMPSADALLTGEEEKGESEIRFSLETALS
jgi:hypothetical protein